MNKLTKGAIPHCFVAFQGSKAFEIDASVTARSDHYQLAEFRDRFY
jgi:hypothetical protein